MKHVRSLVGEPPLLLGYRTAYPGEALRPPHEANVVWDTFRADKAAYVQLLEQLVETQQGLCIYCEQRLVDHAGHLVPLDYQVEHVEPKSGLVGRVLDWTNLTLACCGGTYPHHRDASRRFTSAASTSCGQKKKDDNLTCDPRYIPLLDPVVALGIDGRLGVNAPNCTKAGVAVANVVDALELLNLDCERLRKSRQDIGDHVRSWFVFMLEEILSPQLTPLQQQEAIDLLVARRLQPDTQGNLPRFWSAERSAVGSAAELWLIANQALFA